MKTVKQSMTHLEYETVLSIMNIIGWVPSTDWDIDPGLSSLAAVTCSSSSEIWQAKIRDTAGNLGNLMSRQYSGARRKEGGDWPARFYFGTNTFILIVSHLEASFISN